MATGIGGEVLWICPTLSSTNDIDDLSGNISTPSTHSGASVISETGSGGTHSISFNGTQGIDLGSATIHSGSTFSYSCWFKTTQSINTGGGAGLIGQYIIPNDRGPCLALKDAQAWFYYQSSGGTFNSAEQTNDTSTSNDGNWHHIAAIFEGSSGTAKIYVDGSLVATGSGVPSSVNQTRNLFLGDMNAGLFSGSMDDVRAFDKVLTDQEIVSLSQRRGYEPTNGIGDERLWLCPSLDDSVDDISGNSNHGTYNGGMGTVADVSNGGTRAYFFDGTDDYISGFPAELTNSIGDPANTSVSCWIKKSGIGTDPIFIATKGGSADGWYAQVYVTLSGAKKELAIKASGSFDYIDSQDADDTDWHHYAISFDSSRNATFYYDGVSKGTAAVALPGTSTIALEIGGRSGGNDLISMYIDDYRIFDRPLTTTEITSLASTRGYTSGGGGGEGEGGNLDFHPFNSTHVLD